MANTSAFSSKQNNTQDKYVAIEQIRPMTKVIGKVDTGSQVQAERSG